MESAYEIVRKTSDYSRFKILQGNRKTDKPRVAKIADSIKKVGYIMNPIIVNKNMEVIDGQGRLAALKEMNLPVYYIVVPDAGINECISMNINQKPWTTPDYIKSYADRGNKDYMALQQAYNDYYPGIPQEVIQAALYGNGIRGPQKKTIDSGEFAVNVPNWRPVLNYLDRYTKFKKGFNGTWAALMRILLWIYHSEVVDPDIMYEQFGKYWGALVQNSVLTTEDVLRNLEKVYNYRKREHAYLQQHYDEFIRGLGAQHVCGIKNRRPRENYWKDNEW